jgi:sister-chromatid-cohesion protein PDS5
MARRRTRAKQTPPEEEEPVQEEVQEPEPEDEPEEEEPQADVSQDEADDPRDTADGAQEVKSLQFDEELSWRVGKSIPSGTLLTRLEQLSRELADFDQGEVDLDSLRDAASKLCQRNLLQHKDRGVRAYTACCLVDMLRLFVPEAPFTDDQLKVNARRRPAQPRANASVPDDILTLC